MKLPYAEGAVFVLPLRNGGYARGIAARVGPRGKAVLGYFFGPRLRTSSEATLDGLDPEKACLRIIFGDLGLINGEWKVIGAIPNWDRARWPMPDFVRRDPLGRRKPIVVRYSEDDPLRMASEYAVDADPGLATDSAYGYGAVEIELGKLLAR